MRLFTMGFTKKSAKEFFDIIRNNNVEFLVDIRLNNQSQLAGFSKGRDLEFFLGEICNCKYKHDTIFAPTKEILDSYKEKKITWNDYVEQYTKLINDRCVSKKFFDDYSNYKSVLLLCSEPTPEFCHRRLLAERLYKEQEGVVIIHL